MEKRTLNIIEIIKGNRIVQGVIYIATLISIIITFHVYVGYIVEKKIRDPDMIEKVKAQIRPMVVFDQNDSILVDTGGMQYIETISVILDERKKAPKEIIVTPKLYLAISPILESFDDDFVITSERGKKFQWIYKLGAINRMALQDSATRSGANRFRLEIIK